MLLGAVNLLVHLSVNRNHSLGKLISIHNQEKIMTIALIAESHMANPASEHMVNIIITLEIKMMHHYLISAKEERIF